MRGDIFKRIWSIILILCSIQLVAQDEIRFRKIAKEDGISNNSIFAITQDNKGFLWFGTRIGLNRYDGYRIKKYFHNDSVSSSLVSNDIRSLFYDDSTKSIWVGTHNGLSNFFPVENRFVNYFKEGNVSIFSIIRTSKGRLLIASDKGLFMHDGDTTFTKLQIPINENPSTATLFEDKSHLIWLSLNDELFIAKNSNEFSSTAAKEVYPELTVLDGLQINTIFEDLEGIFWFGSEYDGIFKWSRKNQTIVNYRNDPDDPQSLSSNGVRTISQDIKNRIWIGTSIGINIYQRETDGFRRIINEGSNPGGLSNNSIKSIHMDDKGGIWVGTYYRGINYTDKSFGRFNISYLYSGASSDDRNIVSAISSDREGNILVGTEGKGIGIWNSLNSKFNFLDLGEELRNANVKKIYPYGESIWIGTYRQGLIQLDKNYQLMKSFVHDLEVKSSISSNNVYDILESGEYLWLATYGGGLVKMDLRSKTFESFVEDPSNKNSILTNQVKIVKKGINGDLYVGTSKGVSKLKSDLGKGHFETLLEDVDVYCIESYKTNVLWVGTLYQGLYKIDQANDTIVNYSIKEGLKGSTVYVILPDGDDLWLSTNTGIVKFNTVTEQFFNYGFDLELRRVEFSRNVGHIQRKDLFFMGSTSGLVFFEPSEIVVNEYLPPLVISDLRTLGGGEDEGILNTNLYSDDKKPIILDYANSNLQIEFASLDYTGPVNNKYAYRMKGIDADWIYSVGQPEAIYTFQKEGDYIFEFKGSNSDGVWNPDISSLSITVRPPWFRSWWANTLYLLFFVGISYLLFWLSKLRNTYQLEHIAKEEQAKVHELKMRFFTNITHELRTPLTLMLGPLQDLVNHDDVSGKIRTKLEGILKNVQRLSSLATQLLDFRKLETDHMKLKVSQGDIVDFLKEIFFSFTEEIEKRHIECIFNTEDLKKTLWYDTEKMEKVFFNILSNAIKFTPDFGQIKLDVSDHSDKIVVKIFDNGPGIDVAMRDQIFERFYERGSTNYSNQGFGIGLHLSKQMVELHHGHIYVEEMETAGTTFVVELLKGSAHFNPEEINAFMGDASEVNANAVKEKNKEETDVQAESKLKILIVEDDEEVRQYVKSLFDLDYKVFEASNGLQGLEMASKHLPDLIISDVMMPKMDGITMCAKIKMTLETSHIPVVLLTARTATAYRIGGLETGADDYLVKPFNSSELILKVKNIFSARTAYLEKLSRTHNFDPKKIAVTTMDEKFLIDLMDLTEANIENSNLTIERIADELHVSRALLFTKIKSLTGHTPKGFIKEIRIKRAVQLLKDSDYTISQIAHKIGFQDYRYFTKVFKNKYLMSPKEFQKDQKK
ncbi:MAG: signal transduction histidine kinase/DNA-binding response OmpR family regulator [Cyclobacteriaceae bacterium]|jgi:signal transduction histidine kinase/DNA-binding response OmpR family regulator/ligand-binding sensor domain-containing protein